MSPCSAPDVATAMTFTDDPPAVAVTVIKAVHLTELRQAVDSVRGVAGLGAASFTDTALAGGVN